MAFRTITSEIAKKKKDGGAIIGRTMAFITGAPTAVSEFTSPVYSTFSEGDRVVVQAVREKAVSGTVRWAGSLKASKGTGGMVRVLGIELDKKIDVSKEFRSHRYVLTGAYGTNLFPVAPNHSRVFLPEQQVLHIDEYDKKEQEDGTFSVEYRTHQKEVLLRDNEDSNKDHKTRMNLPDKHEENVPTGGKRDDSFKPGDSVAQMLGDDKIQEQNNDERIQSIDNFPLSQTKPDELQDNPIYLSSYPEYQNVPHYAGSLSMQRSPDSSHFSPYGYSDHGQLSQHYTSYHSQHKDNCDQIPLRFTIGTLVQTNSRGGSPIRGVIQWIGLLQDYKEYFAGVELDYPMEGCTDGSWNGIQYFKCPPGRALFSPVRFLELDTRFMKPNELPPAVIQELKTPVESKTIKQQQQHVSTPISSTALEKVHQFTEEITKLKQQLEEKEIENDKLQKENNVLKTEKDEMIRQLTDLKISCTGVEAENNQLTNQITVLREEVRNNEQRDLADIKYWEVSHTEVKSTGLNLGDGGWGRVEVGFFQGQKVALKMLHSDIVSPFYNDLVRREIAMMVRVRHPNLLLCIAAVLDHPSGSPIIITELMDTSLRKMYTSGALDYIMKLSILRDVASALNYLHCHQDEIIHRDVSSSNVLLEVKGHNQWRAKLSDFGSANLSRLSKTIGPGAMLYSAPEVPKIQTTKMDVYSYGILLCELLTNQFPLREGFSLMLETLSYNWQVMHQLVIVCTKDSPKDRPNMSNILKILYDNYPNILN